MYFCRSYFLVSQVNILQKPTKKIILPSTMKIVTVTE